MLLSDVIQNLMIIPPSLRVQIRGAVGDVIAVLIQNLICLAFGFLIAFVYNWRMALVVLGALPFMVSGSIIYYQTISGGGGASNSHL